MEKIGSKRPDDSVKVGNIWVKGCQLGTDRTDDASVLLDKWPGEAQDKVELLIINSTFVLRCKGYNLTTHVVSAGGQLESARQSPITPFDIDANWVSYALLQHWVLPFALSYTIRVFLFL